MTRSRGGSAERSQGGKRVSARWPRRQAWGGRMHKKARQQPSLGIGRRGLTFPLGMAMMRRLLTLGTATWLDGTVGVHCERCGLKNKWGRQIRVCRGSAAPGGGQCGCAGKARGRPRDGRKPGEMWALKKPEGPSARKMGTSGSELLETPSCEPRWLNRGVPGGGQEVLRLCHPHRHRQPRAAVVLCH